ncbi:transmembrane protein 74 isoform X1 [Scyliorhinus canicula]|uniref:transmembrane protein 74 isoform X1 n=1 Tax=Scyliorhinus canicula TaxID=7830 RepID=UPI0018F69E3B|nr:transmembrane protein 74 isoform X1 [Scyliorhinus canicula]
MASLELVFLEERNNQPCAWKELDWGFHPSFPQISGSAPGTAPFESYSFKQGSAPGTAPFESYSFKQGSAPGTAPFESYSFKQGSAPGTAPFESYSFKQGQHHTGGTDIKVCCDQELETSFTYIDENVNLQRASPGLLDKNYSSQPSDTRTIAKGLQELSIESDDDSSAGSSDTSVDYGFISALLFLFSGITLVIISYLIPRDVTVDPDSVSAREMERLQRESARVGAHLDRCVIAGLGLLTLGGILLSTLLMISICKGELYRRQRLAPNGRSGNVYGSFSFRLKSPAPNSSTQLFPLDGEDTTTID